MLLNFVKLGGLQLSGKTISWVEIFLDGHFPGGNFLGGNVLGGSYPGREFSQVGIFLGGNFPGGNHSGGNFRGGSFPSTKQRLPDNIKEVIFYLSIFYLKRYLKSDKNKQYYSRVLNKRQPTHFFQKIFQHSPLLLGPHRLLSFLI